MGNFLRALTACFVLACAPVSVAAAETATTRQIDSMMAWSTEGQSISIALFEPFGRLPGMAEKPDKAAIKSWAASAHAWSSDVRAMVAVQRARIAALPALPAQLPPKAHEVISLQRMRLPLLANDVEKFAIQLDVGADAVSRGDADAAQRIALAIFDGTALTAQNIRDTNMQSSEMLEPDHPQRFVLRSVSFSYDAILAMSGIQRSIVAKETPSLASIATAIHAHATKMRSEIADGRAANLALTARFARVGALGPADEALRLRLIKSLNMYGPAFDNEAAMAIEIDSAADAISAAAVDLTLYDTINDRLYRISVLDNLRATQALARMNVLQSP